VFEWADVQVGTSLNFDGSDDYVAIPNIINDLSSLTIQAWFKYDNSDTWRWIYGSGTDWVDVGASIASGGNTLRYHFKTTESNFSNGNGKTELANNTWYHFTMTYTGSTVKGYINGKLDFETTISGAIETTKAQMIGAGYTNNNEYFKGNINEVAIWNTGLSSLEVSALYNSGSGLNASVDFGNYKSSSNLKGYWRFAEGSGAIVADASSNSNVGTIYGAIWSTDCANIAV
jgi:hypothetical protein